MSTRATYLFQNATPMGTPSLCLYVHHDGYPVGAASKFAATLETDGRLPEAFIRANTGAEITGGHASHSDTEYRYTISFRPSQQQRDDAVPYRIGPYTDVDSDFQASQASLLVESRLNFGDWDDPANIEIIYDGDLEDFIEQMARLRDLSAA